MATVNLPLLFTVACNSETTARLRSYGIENHLFTAESLPPNYLQFDDDGLALIDNNGKQRQRVQVDFIGGRSGFRMAKERQKSNPLLNATGLRFGEPARIVDATAGFGRDALLLANWGADVTMLERNPLIAALLHDGLYRAENCASEHSAAIMRRLLAYTTDSIIWMQQQLTEPSPPDIVYLDPMFPPKKKSALVKKEMAVLQKLLPESSCDEQELLATARELASNRVIVKRPNEANFLASVRSSYSVTGKNYRYDVYRKPN